MVPISILDEVYNTVISSGLASWNKKKDNCCIDGIYYSCEFYMGGEYIKSTSEYMPRNGMDTLYEEVFMYLEVKDIKKSYGEGGSYIQVLKGISTGVNQGEMCVIEGASGSGKSTFLNCIGGLEGLDSGSISVDGLEISNMKADSLSEYRRDSLGFIFQFYNLVPNLTVKENVQVCEYLTKEPLNMDELLSTLGLDEHKDKFPSQLSGGQQQRCAIARALVKNPKLLLCDEPTGALDSNSAKEILILLETINQKYGTTMLIVTHNNMIKNMVHKVIKIKDGQISREYYNETRLSADSLNEL